MKKSIYPARGIFLLTLSTVRRIIARSIFARVFTCVLACVLVCILACSILACVFACVLTCVLAVYVAAICFVEIIQKISSHFHKSVSYLFRRQHVSILKQGRI